MSAKPPRPPAFDPDLVQRLVAEIQENFPTFGGGRKADGFNPVVAWMEDKPASFAAMVDVEQVVRFILERAKP